MIGLSAFQAYLDCHLVPRVTAQEQAWGFGLGLGFDSKSSCNIPCVGCCAVTDSGRRHALRSLIETLRVLASEGSKGSQLIPSICLRAVVMAVNQSRVDVKDLVSLCSRL